MRQRGNCVANHHEQQRCRSSGHTQLQWSHLSWRLLVCRCCRSLYYFLTSTPLRTCETRWNTAGGVTSACQEPAAQSEASPEMHPTCLTPQKHIERLVSSMRCQAEVAATGDHGEFWSTAGSQLLKELLFVFCIVSVPVAWILCQFLFLLNITIHEDFLELWGPVQLDNACGLETCHPSCSWTYFDFSKCGQCRVKVFKNSKI